MGLLEDLAQHPSGFEASNVADENWETLGSFYSEIAKEFDEDEEAEFYSAISEYGENVWALRDGTEVEVFGYSDLVRHSSTILNSDDPELGYEIALTQYGIEKDFGVRLVSAVDGLLP